ncbi:hypothetical protein [Desulfitobacterium hafniense]|uniref:hypothetical protein n=1 Tax=Desulfitobacterium hafniense TaxID=49338 RepID=UPI00055495B1|nr:hypothetical protein [Desulfitobacterium hafniense]
MTLTLKDFLKLNNGNPVEVCVKEPGECAKYWTTLRDGKSNIHTDNDLDRAVYSIDLIHKSEYNSKILHIYCW